MKLHRQTESWLRSTGYHPAGSCSLLESASSALASSRSGSGQQFDSKNLTQKGCCVAPDCVIHGNGIHRVANGNVDGGAPPDLSARGGRISERSEGCGVGA